ncbi:hypothetical protein Tco_1512383, partial [Tanacetum coccineum]
VSALRELFVFNQDPGENSSQSPPQINHNCCYECGDSLDGIFCQQCTCKSCGKGAHIGYNCPPKVPLISNPELCNQTINELPQTLPSVHPTCNYEDENSFTYDSKPNFFNDFPSVLTHPLQLQFETYLCEICGNNTHYGYDCPPQFLLFPVNYPPQETSREILQAREDLMEAIEAFLKEYGHIPPNEKCMALLLAEERFLKIKQAMEEEQNQPEVVQELLLKLMDNLQILKGSQQEKKETAAQIRIPFGVTPKVILIAWESFGEIKDALMDKQYRQEDIQELMSKLLEDVRNISEEFSEYINCPSWNRPLFYFDDDDDEYTVIWRRPKAITPDEPIEEPDNSLSMGDEHLDTISSVEILVLILSEFEGISDDTCDVPVGEDSSIFDALSDHSEILSDSNDDGTSSDDDDFEDIEYVSLEEVNDVDQEEKEFDLEDILQIQDVILREKLLNINRLITNIESLKYNPTPDRVLNSPSSFPIPV